MPVRKSEIETTMVNPEIGRGFNVPVFYTDELVETSPYDFAFSSIHGAFLPYLFVGYFSDGKGFNQWFFSKARRHDDMIQAIKQDLGKKCDCVYGQIFFNHADLKQGKLRFDKLVINSELPNKKKAKELLIKAIRPDRFHKQFKITNSYI